VDASVFGSPMAPRVGLEVASYAAGYPSVEEDTQGAHVRMDPCALLVARSKTHLTMLNVVLNEAPMALQSRRLSEPIVREHQATHCLAQLRHSTMHIVCGMPSTLLPSFACSKRGGRTPPSPPRALHETGRQLRPTGAHSPPGCNHLNQILRGPWFSPAWCAPCVVCIRAHRTGIGPPYAGRVVIGTNAAGRTPPSPPRALHETGRQLRPTTGGQGRGRNHQILRGPWFSPAWCAPCVVCIRAHRTGIGPPYAGCIV